MGGDSYSYDVLAGRYVISTHSARVGGDIRLKSAFRVAKVFQPTPPVWAETFWMVLGWYAGTFQPTPPVWAETRRPRRNTYGLVISTHSARVGGDLSDASGSNLLFLFQPTPPVWAETGPRPA